MRNAISNTPDDGQIIGTSAYYSPGIDVADPVIAPVRDPYAAMPVNDSAESGHLGSWKIPSPSVGGFLEPFQRLGFSRGLGAFRMRKWFRGGAVERDTMGAHPADGPVGFATRSNTRAKFLTADYTPSDADIAAAGLSNWRQVL